MQLNKRSGSPYWWVSWTDEEGSRHRLSTKETDRAVAGRKAAKMVAEYTPAQAKAASGTISLKDALDAYTTNLTLLEKPSAYQAKLMTKKVCGLLKPGKYGLNPSMKLTELSPVMLERLKMARVAEGASAQTIAHEIKHIRASVMHVKRLRFAAPDITEWNIPSVPRKTRYLTPEEWQRVFDRLDPDRQLSGVRDGKQILIATAPETRKRMAEVQDIFVALTLCGGRWSEVCRLTWSRILWEQNAIRLWGTKGGSKERLVPLPAPLRAVLERKYAERSKDTDLIFPGRDGQSCRSRSTRPIRRAMDDAGLNTPASVKSMGRATIHSLRHTFASWLAQSGATLQEIQNALGHSGVQMTLRYAHLTQADTVAKLNQMLDTKLAQ